MNDYWIVFMRLKKKYPEWNKNQIGTVARKMMNKKRFKR